MAKPKYDWEQIFLTHKGKTARQIAEILGTNPTMVHAAAKKWDRALVPGKRPLKRDYVKFFEEHKGKRNKELAELLGVTAQRACVLKQTYYVWRK